MKKLFLFSILSIFAIDGIQAQSNLEAAVEVGIVIGDASDYTSLSVGAALAYLFDVSDDFKVGPQVGYTNYFGKDFTVGDMTIKADDFGVIPILAKVHYNLTDQIGVDAGAGYAVYTEEGGGGEFTWRVGGSYEFANAWRVAPGYNSIAGEGDSLDAFVIGVRRDF